MPFVRKHAFFTLHFLTVLIVTVAPIVLLSVVLRAEGPLFFLYGLTAICISSIFLGLHLGVKKIRKAFFILSVVFGLAIVCAVLIQVNISTRSLAEAWLDLAREGRAFGFFSFFAAEIYAIFSLAQGLLLCHKKYTSFVLCAAATNFLCAGIILGKNEYLILCLWSAFLFFLLTEKGWKELSEKLRSLSVPFIGGLLLSLLLVAMNVNGPNSSRLFNAPDLSAFFEKFAPTFPLLRDIPGYGISMGAGAMPPSAVLTNRTLFRVQGKPLSVHYLSDTRYGAWNGVFWVEDPNGSETLPISYIGDPVTPGESAMTTLLRMSLAEDFYASLPISADTDAVRLSKDVPQKATLTRDRGVRFEPSARRGMEAVLLSDGHLTGSLEESALSTYSQAGSVPSARIRALAQELGAYTADTGPERDHQYIKTLLDYFSKGFTYSLQTGKRQKTENSIEHFLFIDKKGFCVYFASAFVLLAREGGLKARMAEGFRVSLDSSGVGVLSGIHAHAWPEVWIDGAWRIFEPTPPFTQENPFAYTRAGDSETMRQLEGLFGKSESTTKKTIRNFSWKYPAAFVAAGIVIILAIWLTLDRGTKKLRRKARAMVRRYRRKGIPGPELSGWIAWAHSVMRRNPEEKADEMAQAMIRVAYTKSAHVNSAQARQSQRG